MAYLLLQIRVIGISILFFFPQGLQDPNHIGRANVKHRIAQLKIHAVQGLAGVNFIYSVMFFLNILSKTFDMRRWHSWPLVSWKYRRHITRHLSHLPPPSPTHYYRLPPTSTVSHPPPPPPITSRYRTISRVLNHKR